VGLGLASTSTSSTLSKSLRQHTTFQLLPGHPELESQTGGSQVYVGIVVSGQLERDTGSSAIRRLFMKKQEGQ
jgi:hypothetical protein